MTTRGFPGRVTGAHDHEDFVQEADIRAIEGTFLAQTLAPAAPAATQEETFDHTMDQTPDPEPGQAPTPFS
ncbi:hypothetical protein [Salipiger mucosus]|uniref:Uncharacterized protein n=1 Tax=Salipiger mucosus DSM 16094 TaxID=1123237 RepID=S9QWP3_9RHOB|nr:hypothetical protein [Salipiger mucosus]EPX84002.1 hypothetical protein Salmuc_01777 [Salipiger mucosus DSM 16094]